MRSLYRTFTARRRCIVASARAITAYTALASSTSAFDRMHALRRAAAAERARAANARGIRDADHQDGFTLAATCELIARLMVRLADTEAALWWGIDGYAPAEDGLALPLGHHADAVLAALGTEPVPSARAALVRDLADAVIDTVGTRATDALAAVADCYDQIAGLSEQDRARRQPVRGARR